MKPTIFLDADACPVTAEALAVARSCGVPVVIAGNSTQNLARHLRRGDPRSPTDGFWADTLPVGVGADAADFAIVQELQPGDIVVNTKKRVTAFETTDLDLIMRALGRDVMVITGIMTNCCDLCTAYYAGSKDY